MWFPYREMINNLAGSPVSPCVYAGCNRHATILISVLPDGRLGNCDRLFDGDALKPRPWLESENERIDILEQGHCAGCRYWGVCHGGCPATVPRTAPQTAPPFCEGDYKAYEHIEQWLRKQNPGVHLVTDCADQGVAA
jgi:radical SAM protein with 4Fe4S-binding SPASM domain